MGVNPWPGYAFLYLADELGYFEAEGIPVRLVEFSSLEDARRAYERGHLDALGTTLVDVLQARQHEGRSLQVVRVADFSNGGDLVVVRPGLRRIADLRGKRVAVESASLGAYILARAAEREGLDADDFEWVALDQVQMATALARGEVDAVVTYPPFAVPITALPGTTVAFDTRQIPGEVVDVIAVDSVVALNRRDEIRALLRAFDRAAAAYRVDPMTHGASMARRLGMPINDFSHAISGNLTLVQADAQAPFSRPVERSTVSWHASTPSCGRSA